MGRTAAWTVLVVPFVRYQTAIAFPAGSTATCGLCAPPAERFSAVPHAPPAARTAACATKAAPFERCQTATAFPAASSATSGASASCPGAERSCGALQAPPVGRTADCTSQLAPFQRRQTATAFPAPSTATCCSYAFWPAAERLSGGLHKPPAGRTVA